jgi:hypothetical protein
MSDEHTPDPRDAGAPPVQDEPAATPPASPAVARFYACRWHKPADPAAPAYCTHRDVFPMAGATGFSAESWCVDCQYYKVKRVTRRPPFA